VNVDESKSYSIPVDFTDGEHTVDIVAKYLPDNSTTTSSLTFSVDTTAPVVTSVSDIATDIKVAEDFNITVVSEPGATITAFINNQAYPFPASASGTFVLNAKAPLDTGSFPVTIEAMDQFGNKTTVQEPTTLKVVSGIPGLTNLIGIPEEGAISLTWDALPGAAGYKIEVKSGGQTLSTETASASNYTVSQLNNGTQYTLTVRAIDVSGADASLPSSTIALEPLVLSAAAGDDGSASLIAQDQPLPPRHTNSGPEVYFIIALSILMLDFYARARRKLMD
jgi:hypothetical protein